MPDLSGSPYPWERGGGEEKQSGGGGGAFIGFLLGIGGLAGAAFWFM